MLNWIDPLQSALSPAGAALAGGVQAMDMPALLALAAALGWASGLRLYAVLFLVGGSGLMGWIPLPSSLQLLQHPIMLLASGMMLFVEFFADKIPGLDTAVNTSPEPFSNIGVSLVEDGLVVGALWLATQHPLVFGVALIVALVLMTWLLIVLLTFLQAVLRRIGSWLTPAPAH